MRMFNMEFTFWENSITVLFICLVMCYILFKFYQCLKHWRTCKHIAEKAVVVSKYVDEGQTQTVYRSRNETNLGVVEHHLVHRAVFKLQDVKKTQVDLELSAEVFDMLDIGMSAELSCNKGRLVQFGRIVNTTEKRGGKFITMKW